jgi:hypothetical protein
VSEFRKKGILDLKKAINFLESGDNLNVNLTMVTSITDQAAKALSLHEDCLELDGLTDLSDKAAEYLSKHQGGSLSLNGLTELSDFAAEALSKHQEDLYLTGLIKLSDAGMEAISKGAFWLCLDGLTQLTATAAETLSKHQGGTLSLNGLSELSDAAAESLSKYQGDLSLNSLTELSDVAADALSKHCGELVLNGLIELTATAAEALSKHQGYLFLNSLTELTDSAAESLSKHQGNLWLGGLTEISDAAAEALSKHQGELGFRDLTELSNSAAAALSKHQGKISNKDSADWVASLKSKGNKNSYRVITSELKSSEQGKPSEAFYSLNDGLFLVNASSEQFTRCVTEENARDLISYADCRCIALQKYNSGYWVVAVPLPRCRTAGLDGADLSKKLATRVVQMIYYDTVGTCALFVWDNGMRVEFFSLSEWWEEHDRTDEITEANLLDIEPKCSYSLVIQDEQGSYDSITFQSSLSLINEADLRGGLKIIDERFKDLNIPFPPADLKWLR